MVWLQFLKYTVPCPVPFHMASMCLWIPGISMSNLWALWKISVYFTKPSSELPPPGDYHVMPTRINFAFLWATYESHMCFCSLLLPDYTFVFSSRQWKNWVLFILISAAPEYLSLHRGLLDFYWIEEKRKQVQDRSKNWCESLWANYLICGHCTVASVRLWWSGRLGWWVRMVLRLVCCTVLSSGVM